MSVVMEVRPALHEHSRKVLCSDAVLQGTKYRPGQPVQDVARKLSKAIERCKRDGTLPAALVTQATTRLRQSPHAALMPSVWQLLNAIGSLGSPQDWLPSASARPLDRRIERHKSAWRPRESGRCRPQGFVRIVIEVLGSDPITPEFRRCSPRTRRLGARGKRPARRLAALQLVAALTHAAGAPVFR